MRKFVQHLFLVFAILIWVLLLVAKVVDDLRVIPEHANRYDSSVTYPTFGWGWTKADQDPDSVWYYGEWNGLTDTTWYYSKDYIQRNFCKECDSLLIVVTVDSLGMPIIKNMAQGGFKIKFK